QGIWRYHVTTKRFELFAEGGGNTWGIDFDRNGQLFAGGNTNEPLCHHVQGAYYIKGFGKHGPLHNPFAFGYFNPVKHVGFLGTALTGGCVIYQGGLLPERFNDVCIYPNLRANAMRVSQLVPAGSTFESHYQEDFAVSSDIWFRPVDCLVGPDGALYAADWCDINISHTNPQDRSQWYPPSREDGRIWRFVPNGTNPRPMEKLALEEQTSNELIKLLGHRNAWYSREARRVLGERRDRSVIKSLLPLLFGDDDHLALEALWATYVSGGFNNELAVELLSHRSPAVRAWTIRLLGDEKRVSAAVLRTFLELAEREADPTVRSQLACTAKRLPGYQALPLIEKMLRRDEDARDAHIPLLLWWAVEDKAVSDRRDVAELFAKSSAWQHSLVRDVIVERLVRRYAGERSEAGWESCVALLNAAPDIAQRNHLIAAIDVQLAGARLDTPPAQLTRLVESLLSQPTPAPAVLRLALRLQIVEALRKSLQLVSDRSASAEDRAALIAALGAAQHPECVDRLLPCLSKDEPSQVRSAAMSALQAYDDGKIAESLVACYPEMTPELKAQARGLMVSRGAWAQTLIDAVKAGKIAASEVDIAQVRQMLVHEQPELNRQIESLWGKVTPSTTREKQGKINAVQTMLAKGKGDASAGKALVLKHCCVCHQLFGEGNKIGPDLTTADRKNLAVLLPNVIDPSAVIRPEFVAYSAQTVDGRVLVGLMADSGPDSVTLLDAKNVRTTLARNGIETLEPAATSLMPERLLDTLTTQEICDLFAFLRTDGAPPAR
ncbi:MAG TPA: HEAT repeat domain-containing protein, partial [Pirellulales bacterium]|nr:HEAT repeat domain-containing protein [Pirellulales bacterium]